MHADLWSPNIIFKKEMDSPGDDLLAIIDFQATHSGNPMADIARLLGINTSSSYRRANTKKIVQQYFDCVKSYMNDDIPFTIDQLETAYDFSMGYAAVFIGFGVPSYLNMPGVVGEGEERIQKQKEIIDRCKCFFEDTIAAFEKQNYSF